MRAGFTASLHFLGRFAHCLNYQCDRSLVTIEIGDRQGNSFPMIVQDHDDELAGLGRLGEQGCLYFEEERNV